MIYTTKSVNKKSAEWYIISIVDGGGQLTEEVSVNKVNKNGEVFPHFDDIEEGKEVVGSLWTSQAGKNYLFAPKPEGEKKGGAGMAMKAMEIKKNNIAEFQGKKEESIANAQRNTAWIHAKDCATQLYVADRIGSKLDNEDEVLSKIQSFATKIVNLELAEPF